MLSCLRHLIPYCASEDDTFMDSFHAKYERPDLSIRKTRRDFHVTFKDMEFKMSRGILSNEQLMRIADTHMGMMLSNDGMLRCLYKKDK